MTKPILTNLDEVKKALKIVLFNHGVKSSKEFPGAELYLDCRGIANPSHGGPMGSGDDPKVQEWVSLNSDVTPFFWMVKDNFQRLTVRKGLGHEYDKPFRICTMCAHGIHRSRAMKHILATMLKTSGYLNVTVE